MKKPLYIFSNGQLRRKDNTIFFVNEEGDQKYIPVEDTSELMIFGEVDLNKRFLEFCTQKEIMIHYFNNYGYYSGTFYPREHYNSGYMILRQAEAYLDDERRLVLARQFVNGAYLNIRQVLKYYVNRGKDVESKLTEIERLSEGIKDADNIPQLMAFEGNIREQYYKAFDAIHGQPEFIFEGRSKRPPKNEMNTLISFGNSIVYSTVLSEIYKTHLDPRIGYLHTTNFRRFSLNLDVAEIFKPILVDRVIFTLISKKMLKKSDFKKESGGLMLKESGRRVFVEELENRLKTTINHRDIGTPVSYRRLIRLELYKLEKHLMGEKDYETFVSQW
ncbi:type I-B CRISPR-associated endonuclease Cas1b [Dehalobacterium formicoaceticum]|uniref:CRISPR-associated endonuclease Cas1 n=1 Tax=Dehalobacterium formicoaceticum TaxID=51515 RepID=A0ABT1Y7M7_9FIRM|nr:type I-B CRISPR-associated endonuclease Cas1b [Dehalobacterium formicoaceticum]MCR6546873.1 type I-B CRISPR-associated endonuclease Cas1b [Dehalobacterium formicoaceticum]